MTVPGVYSPEQGKKRFNAGKMPMALSWIWLGFALLNFLVADSNVSGWACLVLSGMWQATDLVLQKIEKRS